MLIAAEKKSLPVGDTFTTASLAGVSRNQTVCLAQNQTGSPGSMLASLRSAAALNGSAETIAAFAKSSLLGRTTASAADTDPVVAADGRPAQPVNGTRGTISQPFWRLSTLLKTFADATVGS